MNEQSTDGQSLQAKSESQSEGETVSPVIMQELTRTADLVGNMALNFDPQITVTSDDIPGSHIKMLNLKANQAVATEEILLTAYVRGILSVIEGGKYQSRDATGGIAATTILNHPSQPPLILMTEQVGINSLMFTAIRPKMMTYAEAAKLYLGGGYITKDEIAHYETIKMASGVVEEKSGSADSEFFLMQAGGQNSELEALGRKVLAPIRAAVERSLDKKDLIAIPSASALKS